jgi:N,N-dimethylformamidase
VSAEPPLGVMGYVGAPSAEPGASLPLHVRSTDPRWSARLVRLRALEIPSVGIERRAEPVDGVAAFERETIEQRTPVGSYARAPLDAPVDYRSGLTVAVIALPTLPGHGRQAMLAQRDERGATGWSLGLDDDGAAALRLATTAGELAVRTADSLVRGCWSLITAVVDPVAGVVRITAAPVGAPAANRVIEGRGRPQAGEQPLPGAPAWAAAAPLLLGAGWLEDDLLPHDGYDGRLDRPVVVARALDARAAAALPLAPPLDDAATVAAWDFAAGIGPRGFARPSHVHDAGPRAVHGTSTNHPTRAVGGHNFDGDRLDFRHAPEQYAALHFHRDAMTDCRWTPQADVVLPDDLPSGAYAVRLESGGHEDLVPFVVRPPCGTATADVLVVLSTNSYLAYANDHVAIDSPRVQGWTMQVPALDAFERLRYFHRELGPSLYEWHLDSAGVCHSSWRRPILTMRPQAYNHNGPVWQFPADMQVLDWLDRKGIAADVVCDRDVHDGGAGLLERYRCVLTGSHPEYQTGPMLDAYEAYAGGGGRLCYLGGNGMYWVTAYDPEDPHVIEIRRASGTQAWAAPPGEHHLSFTGEPGGTWRSRRRAPQKSMGVGFVAHGNPRGAAGYRRAVPDDSPAAWVFAGLEVAEGDGFGDYGVMGGAAGIELDATDPELGTPVGTILLASSVGHSDDVVEARENYNMTHRALGGARNPKVRSDMVLVPRAGGGAVFSTGSIGWVSSLSHDDYDNEISRILANVIARFAGTGPVLD